MNKSIANNKLIAKNAVFLYIRMFIMMTISLYTSRVVLQVLGVADYGIYNIVGGIIVFFHFFNSTISGTLQRFFNVEMGKGDDAGLKRIYDTGNAVQVIICFVVVVISETIGLYFINHYLNIDKDRMVVANIVYQISLLTFCLNLLRTPQQSLLIASERMSFYTYSSVFEAFAKLLCVGALTLVFFDKLIVYALFQSLIALLMLLLFVYQVKKQLSFRIGLCLDRKYFNEILYFSGWNVLGASFALTVNQVINIFLNMFHGILLNAAAGLASHISSAVNQFSSNLAMAFSPQIVKLYSANELDKFRVLVFRASKTSFLLYSLVGIPFICLAEFIMDIWLIEVPEHAVVFSQLCVIDLAVESFTFPLYASIQASGKVKMFNIGVSIIFLINIPLMYFSMWCGFPPYSIYMVKILTDMACLTFRCVFMERNAGIKATDFVINVICPTMLVIVIVSPIIIGIMNIQSHIAQVALTLFFLIPAQALLSLRLCFTKPERDKIKEVVLIKFNKK